MSDDTPVSDSASSTPVSEPSPTPVEAVPMPPEPPAEPQTAQIPVNEPLPETTPEVPSAPVTASPSASVAVFARVVNVARDLLAKARAVMQERKRKKLEKILEETTRRGFITNDQVEKLFRVSDATATRYLSQLEKEGKIQQIGTTGKSVKYQML